MSENDAIKKQYSLIAKEESFHTRSPSWTIPDTEEMYSTAKQIGEFAEAALMLRSYNNIYSLTKDKTAFESTGAHTNLVAAIIDRALSYLESQGFRYDEYSYREIMEAVRLHDLPENMMGDIPDNGDCIDRSKRISENLYYNIFNKSRPEREAKFIERVKSLLDQMEDKSSEIGKLIYCSDKVAALMITLQYDKNGTPPTLKMHGRKLSERDHFEMDLCDVKDNNRCHASEMWTVDWFEARKLIEYDTTGFFTALIIMRTLQVRGCWYKWREKNYYIVATASPTQAPRL